MQTKTHRISDIEQFSEFLIPNTTIISNLNLQAIFQVTRDRRQMQMVVYQKYASYLSRFTVKSFCCYF